MESPTMAPPGAPGAPAGPGDDIPPWPIWTVPATLLLGVGLGIVAVTVLDIAATGGSSTNTSWWVTILGNVGFDLGFVAAALWFTSRVARPRAADFGFRRVRVKRGAVAVVLGAIGYFGVSAIYAAVFSLHKVEKLPSGLGDLRTTANVIGTALFVCVFAPIAEELFFRGFLFGTLRRIPLRVAGRDLGPWIGALLTAILFGAAHVGSAGLEYLVPLGLLGFMLCLVRWRTGSLYPCIVLHSANNALALGVNQLGWTAAEVLALIFASWLVTAAITWPLSARTAPIR
ncbi:MAG: CPBP family intramembrane metalloprotease [Actinomycetota bacterium]|nr:CPBP family intramembrane metalloprotease [Actinomycetota bacterium]